MRQNIIDYQECIKLISDIHKHARGRRPSIEWMEWFNELPFEHQCEAVDQLLALGYEREDVEAKARMRTPHLSASVCMRGYPSWRKGCEHSFALVDRWRESSIPASASSIGCGSRESCSRLQARRQ